MRVYAWPGLHVKSPKINYCIGSLNVGVALRVQHFSAFHLKCFLFLFQYFFVITFYVLNNFFTQYKHTYGQLRASHGSHMKAAHTVLYMKKHTQTYASYPAMDISCMSVV